MLRLSLTEAPSLPRSYPASSVLRTSPSPHTARPVSRELPVDPRLRSPLGLPVLRLVSLRACCRHYPGRIDRAYSLVFLHRRRPSLYVRQVGSCIGRFGACSAFTYVTAGTFAKSPLRPFPSKASAASSPLPLLRLLPGGANQLPGGTCTRCRPSPFHGALTSEACLDRVRLTPAIQRPLN